MGFKSYTFIFKIKNKITCRTLWEKKTMIYIE